MGVNASSYRADHPPFRADRVIPDGHSTRMRGVYRTQYSVKSAPQGIRVAGVRAYPIPVIQSYNSPAFPTNKVQHINQPRQSPGIDLYA